MHAHLLDNLVRLVPVTAAHGPLDGLVMLSVDVLEYAILQCLVVSGVCTVCCAVPTTRESENGHATFAKHTRTFTHSPSLT